MLQVVVPQGVLVRASAELTVTQALEIADMTLETSCRAIQWALNVPEVLMASAGEKEEAVFCKDPHPRWLPPLGAHRLALPQGCCQLLSSRPDIGMLWVCCGCVGRRGHAVARAGPAAVQAAAVTPHGAAGDVSR